MKRIVCLCGVLALAMAGVAAAASTTLKGGVQGDANSKVTMKVKLKNGKPKKVSDLAVTNIELGCSDGTERVFDSKLSGLKLERNAGTGDYEYSSIDADRDPDVVQQLRLRVDKKAKQAFGDLTITVGRVDEVGCSNASLSGEYKPAEFEAD